MKALSHRYFAGRSTLVFLDKANEEDVYFHKQRRRLLPARSSGVLETEQRDEVSQS